MPFCDKICYHHKLNLQKISLPAGATGRTSRCTQRDPDSRRRDSGAIHWSREILQLAFQKGVPITFGSDAHAPEEVGMNFAETIQLARSVGYKECCRFMRRECESVTF